MKKTQKLFISTLLLLNIGSIHAWNALGHRLIGQIAYNHLDKTAREKIDYYNQALNTVYHQDSFVNAGPWMDNLRYVKDQWMKALHYIDIPFTLDGSELIEPEEPNAVTAIIDAQKVLKNQHATNYDRGFSARILLHVIGDLHQPMHAVSQFSPKHPKGDLGGNLYFLGSNSVGGNLHAYWDNGGGFLQSNGTINDEQLMLMAEGVEAKYPCDLTKIDNDPTAWSAESFEIAKEKAYSTKQFQIPAQDYQAMVQELTQQRISIAGCRLAKFLALSLL